MEVMIAEARPRLLAAARRRVRLGEVASAWRPALDEVWAFLRTRPGLRTDGHNVFLYHHLVRRGDPMDVDFGVEIVRRFEPSGGLRCVETPAGRVAAVDFEGPITGLRAAHDAIHAYAARNGLVIGDRSWEIYGDPGPDPSRFAIRVEYLLA